MTEHAHHHAHGPANRRRRILRTAAPLYVVEPPGPVRGGVVLLHDLPGLTRQIERQAQALARDGWLVAAPYHYYDSGGRVYPSPDQAPALTAESLRADVTAALDYLATRRGLPRAQLAAVGVGLGGHLVRWAAAACTLGAAIAIDTAIDRPTVPGAVAEPPGRPRCPLRVLSTPDWSQVRRFLARPGDPTAAADTDRSRTIAQHRPTQH